MKKRIFALLMALVLALGLAVTAGADEPVALRQTDITNGTYWQEGNPYHLAEGSYKLMGDIVLEKALTIDAGEVVIDLNGYTLSLKSGVQDSVICVTGQYGYLDIEDSSAAKTGRITGGTGRAVDSIYVGGGICLLNGGTVNMYGGTITGCTAALGGGVYAEGNFSFYMYGGTITGCTATTSGGGIYAANGNYYMNGGTVSGCTAANGGAVCLDTTANDQFTIFHSKGGMIRGAVYVGKQCRITPDELAHEFNQQTVFDGTVTVKGAIGGGVYKGQVSRTDMAFLANGIFWHDRNGILQVNGDFSSVAGMYGATPYIVNFNFDANILYSRCTVLVARYDNSPSEDSAAQTRASVTDDKSDVRDIYLAAPDAPAREGYTFLGWYTASEGGEKWDFDVDALSQSQLADGVTLYAQWESSAQEPIRRQHVTTVEDTTDTADTTKTDESVADAVTSAKTFDAGVAVYGAMAVLSMTGTAWVARKRS